MRDIIEVIEQIHAADPVGDWVCTRAPTANEVVRIQYKDEKYFHFGIRAFEVRDYSTSEKTLRRLLLQAQTQRFVNKSLGL
jgi:hypothetical protein